MQSHYRNWFPLIVAAILTMSSFAEAANPCWRSRLAAARARRCCCDQAAISIAPCQIACQPVGEPQASPFVETAAQTPPDQSAKPSSEKPETDPQLAVVKTTTICPSTVADALEWITNHQLPDGSWNFDHTIGPGMQRGSPNPGTLKEAKNAATALALLSLLGAAQTHKEGQYKDNVQRGLDYLVANLKSKDEGGSFEEPGGSMYSHGLATLALCEAYGMTADMKLIKPAQAAIDYIVWAQDPIGGGWRYTARMPGDTSVFGWQFAALKSAQLAGLDVPAATIAKATEYLDSVGADNGAFYGYTGPARGVSTTAIGLLCRMEMGWDNADALKTGTEFLAAQGPSLQRANMYYNFYATQAMFYHSRKIDDDEAWMAWQKELRDYLIDQQAAEGPAAGSWYFGHAWSNSAGRLYDTCLATLTLEVYYRHLPLWKKGPPE